MQSIVHLIAKILEVSVTIQCVEANKHNCLQVGRNT